MSKSIFAAELSMLEFWLNRILPGKRTDDTARVSEWENRSPPGKNKKPATSYGCGLLDALSLWPATFNGSVIYDGRLWWFSLYPCATVPSCPS